MGVEHRLRLIDLQRQKVALTEKIENSEKILPDFDATLRTAMAFLASPWKREETRKLEENYNGLALDSSEGNRIAGCIGDTDVIFMRNHGVMVLGQSIPEVWDDLYYLERASEAQVLAESTGQKLVTVSADVAKATFEQFRNSGTTGAVHHLKSVRRHLDNEGSNHRE